MHLLATLERESSADGIFKCLIFARGMCPFLHQLCWGMRVEKWLDIGLLRLIHFICIRLPFIYWTAAQINGINLINPLILYCHNSSSIPPNTAGVWAYTCTGRSRAGVQAIQPLLWFAGIKGKLWKTSFPGLKPYDLLDFSAEIPDSGAVERAVCGILQNKISGHQIRISAFDCHQQNLSLECTHWAVPQDHEQLGFWSLCEH